MGSPPLVAWSEHLLKPNGSISGKAVANTLLPRLSNLLETIPTSTRPALACIDGRQPITHTQIHRCLQDTGKSLHTMKLGRGHRVALVLPNGPELALAILATTAWCSCVPLNTFGAKAELKSDLIQSSVDLVIGLYSDHGGIKAMAQDLGIAYCELLPDSQFAGLFTLIDTVRVPGSPKRALQQQEADRSAGSMLLHEERFQPNSHRDEILVLFTSGTTGKKKLVPHRLADVLIATACISVSWKLSTCDTNCNLMPLFHVGGIIRQVFSPILSGGCVICCPSFDPTIFWQLLQQQAFTWYYAAPTMHHVILQYGRSENLLGTNIATPKLRMIANAAGGLLPSLARELRHAFHCNVLPSYGMTECMPITSPPANYQLEKPGTSGVAVGPEVAILCVETLRTLPIGREGAICVRNEPCFRGYGILAGEQEENSQTFLKGGWFNTGDLGYMDADGYLYITGRSKEVINRGGEIISPLEVEEAVNAHPDVQTSVAFSTKHSVLQEVVGILLVPAPHRPKIDLPALQAFLGEGRLAAPKWPQCLVYMDALPKSHTNKLLRVKLGDRLSLPEMNDSMYAIERTFQAACPPIGTPVSVAIPCQRVKVDPVEVQRVLRNALVEGPHQELHVVPHPSKLGTLVVHVFNIDRVTVLREAEHCLDAFAVPSHVCLMRERDQEFSPPQQSDAVVSILLEETLKGKGPTDPLVIELQDLLQHLLDLDCLPDPDSNFFNLGGSSMKASQLASKIRKIHHVSFGGADVFHHSTCQEIAKVIRDRQRQNHPDGGQDRDVDVEEYSASMAVSSLLSKLPGARYPFEASRMDRSFNCFASMIQLVPLCIIYPFWQLTRFFLFFRVLVEMLVKVPRVHSLLTFVATLVVYHFVWVTVTPLAFILIKWTVIGRYRKGRYPIWSSYYLRWWFVDVMRKLIGRGIWGSNEKILNFYYRLLGARIGSAARISLEADVAEYDLVSIGEGAAVEFATVRGFGVDNGCMILGPVVLGDFASVGVRSVVAPFTSVPDNTHLGPTTSSYELGSLGTERTADLHFGRYNRCALPEPHFVSQLLVIHPITFFVDTMSHMPALYVLYWMVSMPWHRNDPFSSINDVLAWLCDTRRIPFFIGIRAVRAIVAPLVYMLFALIVKWLIIGRFKPGPRDTQSEWQLIRHHLAAKLFSRENVQECAELLGRHYNLVSTLYRLMGARVGERVFWPGHQPIFTGEYDLLEIGDDVVFGSRAALFCTTTDSCEKIILCAGSNVSDNTVVLPGSILGKNSVLGSNTLCPAGRYMPESSVWFGSRGGEPVMLEKGIELIDGTILSRDVDVKTLPLQGDASTLRPFGRAFYNREASHFVHPLGFIVIFTLVSKVVFAVIHIMPLLLGLHATAAYYYGIPVYNRVYDRYELTFVNVYPTLLLAFCVAHTLQIVVWLGIELAAKWGFMGRRQEGRYNWDSSDYGQRWELYQIVTRIRSIGRMNILDFLSGTPFLATFFRWNGCKIGKDCCLYPAGADPFPPEPDLVEMGDRCVIDCASVVCHLNTRGNFELVKIRLENNVTLRSHSRIQQGVHMETGSMLLEKSLAMTGEVIEADSVWQGAPASRIFSYDTSSIGTNGTEQSNYGYHRYI